jgi:hypothetical protein
MNEPSSAAGIDGNAVSLNRTTSPYLIYDGVAMPSADHVEFSVSLWVKLASMPETGHYWSLVSQGAPDWAGYLIVGVVGDGAYSGLARLEVAIGGRGGSSLGGGRPAWIGDTDWHHIVVTHSSDGTATDSDGIGTLYLDGVNPNPPWLHAYSGAWGMVFEPDLRIGDLRMAIYPKPPEGYGVNGLIDEVAIWDRTLSGSEVAELYSLYLSPEKRIESLVAQLQALVSAGALAQGPGNALVVSLQAALSKLAQGNTAASCNTLQAFANKVESFMGDGTLTTGQGNALLSAVNGITAQLCG